VSCLDIISDICHSMIVLASPPPVFCQAFWKYAPVVEPYIHDHSKPLWNGEDIFFSLVSYKTTGLIPLIVRASKVFMSQRSTGIHFTGGHDRYRDDFLKHAVHALDLSYPDISTQDFHEIGDAGGKVRRPSEWPRQIRRKPIDLDDT